jgi:hypothetical protein
MSFLPQDSKLHYKILDHLPKIPQHLVEGDWLGEEHFKWSSSVTFEYGGSQAKTGPVIVTNEIKSEALKQWLRENIETNLNSVLYRKVMVTPEQNFYPPHIDVRRNFALMYNLNDSGGDLVIWKEKNKPMIQGSTLPTGRPKLFNDYSVLEEVHRFSPPVNTWYIINSQCIHSVEDIKSVREGIHIACTFDSQHVKLLNPALV